jgi:hypothetical protein
MLALPFTNKNGQFSMQKVEPASFTNHSAKYFEMLLPDAEQLPRRDQSHIIRSQFFFTHDATSELSCGRQRKWGLAGT